jgi:hypothetical protein
MAAQHVLGGHAQQFFRRAVDAGDREIGRIQDQGIRQLVETASSNR